MKPEMSNINRWSEEAAQRKNEEAKAWHEFRIKFLVPMLGLIFFVCSVALVLWAVGTMIKGLLAPAC